MNAENYPILEPTLAQKADEYLDGPMHEKANELGQQLYRIFGTAQGGYVSTQVRNLQQNAVSATRLGDIEDFVKNQMGRGGSARDWQQIGPRLLEQLADLRHKAQNLASGHSTVQEHLLRLYLARGWIRAVIGGYMYAKACQEMKRGKSS
jgi:hypothetical protein